MRSVLGVGMLLRALRWRILMTWMFVLVENALLALTPLFIGRAIDGLLNDRPDGLFEVAALMGSLIVIATARRLYDTRVYGTMRARLGAELVRRSQQQPVSQINARLGMSREIVDFLEEDVPALFTAIVQVTVSILLLWTFDVRLGISAVVAMLVLGATYALFHGRFFRINRDLNAQTERQVAILNERRKRPVTAHLLRLRQFEVKLSDTEATLYGLAFLAFFAFILTNLWLASTIPAVTAGVMFAILSYSWELVESGIALPIVMQQWSRLSEIRERLNNAVSGETRHVARA